MRNQIVRLIFIIVLLVYVCSIFYYLTELKFIILLFLLCR
jgi:hypothetical protein